VPALWVGITGYGLFNGPASGFILDLVNRLTPPSEIGMAIIMFGTSYARRNQRPIESRMV
jgi:hypothetical protein